MQTILYIMNDTAYADVSFVKKIRCNCGKKNVLYCENNMYIREQNTLLLSHFVIAYTAVNLLSSPVAKRARSAFRVVEYKCKFNYYTTRDRFL